MVATGFVFMMLTLAAIGFMLAITGVIGIVITRIRRKRIGKSIIGILSGITLALGIIVLLLPSYYFIAIGTVNYQSSQYEKSLSGAVSRGDINRVSYLLDNGANPDKCAGGNIYTPLITACNIDDRYDAAKLLIEHGSNVNIESTGYDDGSEKGYTPIFYAAYVISNYDIVKMLIAKGADINHKSDDGTTPLIRACEASNYKAAELLIKSGADVNAIDKEGKSVLYHACNPKLHFAVLDIIKALLENGADPNYEKNKGIQLKKLVLENKSKVKETFFDYKKLDYGKGVNGFDDNYKKIIDILNTYEATN